MIIHLEVEEQSDTSQLKTMIGKCTIWKQFIYLDGTFQPKQLVV